MKADPFWELHYLESEHICPSNFIVEAAHEVSHAELGKHYTRTAANGDGPYSYRLVLLLLLTKISKESEVQHPDFSMLLMDLTVIGMCVFQSIFENLAQYFQIAKKNLKKKKEWKKEKKELEASFPNPF